MSFQKIWILALVAVSGCATAGNTTSQYLDHEGTVANNGVGNYSIPGVQNTASSVSHADRGSYLDHDATVAGGGVGNYGAGPMTEAPKVATAAPAPAPVAVAAPAETPIMTKENAPTRLENLSKDLYFGPNSAALSAKQKASLKTLSGELLQHPDWKLDLIGHADPSGSPAANQKLSLKRANAVEHELSGYGVPSDQMNVKPMGAVADSGANARKHFNLDRNVEIRMHE